MTSIPAQDPGPAVSDTPRPAAVIVADFMTKVSSLVWHVDDVLSMEPDDFERRAALIEQTLRMVRDELSTLAPGRPAGEGGQG